MLSCKASTKKAQKIVDPTLVVIPLFEILNV